MEQRRNTIERMDFRFPPSPYCSCGQKVPIRVSESAAFSGRLYYGCCICGFFRWVYPCRATWVSSGVPIQAPAAHVSNRDYFADFDSSDFDPGDFEEFKNGDYFAGVDPSDFEEFSEVSSSSTGQHQQVAFSRNVKNIGWKVAYGFLGIVILGSLILKL